MGSREHGIEETLRRKRGANGQLRVLRPQCLRHDGDDVVHKAYISVALPPANAGFGIPKIILSEQVLSEAELGEALDKAAELNARWLQAFAESNPDKVESLADLRNRGIEHPETEADHKAAVELVKADLIKRGFEVRDAERAATK
ncbi:MAG: hypothetical protein DMG96_12515 [Acidobacteria bacterium]|nr:MAG: hypothetical protein DMG96_12515 [Acidobacteriota bacterium]